MPKSTKTKKKVTKIKPKKVSSQKEVKKTQIKISKTYIPKDTEKYMCEKDKIYFRIMKLYITEVWMIIVFQQI